MTTRERLPYSAVYVVSLFLTLYTAMAVRCGRRAPASGSACIVPRNATTAWSASATVAGPAMAHHPAPPPPLFARRRCGLRQRMPVAADTRCRLGTHTRFCVAAQYAAHDPVRCAASGIPCGTGRLVRAWRSHWPAAAAARCSVGLAVGPVQSAWSVIRPCSSHIAPLRGGAVAAVRATGRSGRSRNCSMFGRRNAQRRGFQWRRGRRRGRRSRSSSLRTPSDDTVQGCHRAMAISAPPLPLPPPAPIAHPAGSAASDGAPRRSPQSAPLPASLCA